MSLVAQELPQLPEPPAQVQEMPTSIMEEAEQVTTSLLPGSDIPTAAIIDVDKTEPIKQIQNAPSEFQVPTPPVMETPKTADQLDAEENTIDIGLSADARQKIGTLLNRLLADEYVLYTKTLKYHWNVKGITFHDFHKAFKEQYEALFDIVDAVAERARALGQPAAGSLQEFGTLTRLQEIDGQKLTAVQMVKQLLADHEAIIKTLRAEIDATAQLGDQGTSNFLQDLIVKHEKIAWMLRATAQ
jgi:starvation-inducible DNA-binding protein